ncbi:hypothetical protein C8R41DRAFT_45632 [Lentinula lateritia]|uniref:Uncharacterized protein n=1 Tax=Lentinula lateritia TaxID=40482 RepID=A0ABQ8V093_9AGAR|nr:hypothetical protein C8R41DRAFT_45632 [Lentinula lateritia]
MRISRMTWLSARVSGKSSIHISRVIWVECFYRSGSAWVFYRDNGLFGRTLWMWKLWKRNMR